MAKFLVYEERRNVEYATYRYEVEADSAEEARLLYEDDEAGVGVFDNGKIGATDVISVWVKEVGELDPPGICFVSC